MVVVRGDGLTLRPLRKDEIDVVWEAANRRPPRDQIAERISRSGELTDGLLDLALDVDGRLIGDVQARAPKLAFPPGVFEVGIHIYDTGDRGRGWGVDGLRLLVGYLFESKLAERVQGSTALDNNPMRQIFERLGFVEEGILRSFMPADGGREDYVLYGLTRTEWEGVEA